MCDLCRKNPCDYRCPNYDALKSKYKCHICNENILIGEEYIKNYNEEYAHIDCLSYSYDLLDFLGYHTRIMDLDNNI